MERSLRQVDPSVHWTQAVGHKQLLWRVITRERMAAILDVLVKLAAGPRFLRPMEGIEVAGASAICQRGSSWALPGYYHFFTRLLACFTPRFMRFLLLVFYIFKD